MDVVGGGGLEAEVSPALLLDVGRVGLRHRKVRSTRDAAGHEDSRHSEPEQKLAHARELAHLPAQPQKKTASPSELASIFKNKASSLELAL